MIFGEWSLPVLILTHMKIFSLPHPAVERSDREVSLVSAWNTDTINPLQPAPLFLFFFFFSGLCWFFFHNKKETNFIIILFPLHLKAWYVCCWHSISASNISVTGSHRITEWVRLEGSSDPTSLLKLGHPKVHCTGLCPDCHWISPVNETPQPLWVVCSSA